VVGRAAAMVANPSMPVRVPAAALLLVPLLFASVLPAGAPAR